MFFRVLLLGITIAVVLILFEIILPKLKQKYRLHKKLMERKRKEEAFRKKMKELEIN